MACARAGLVAHHAGRGWTRSMLRHLPVNGLKMPRPLRAWNGAEHGLDDLTQAENDQGFLDDVLMLRFMLLYVISEEVRRAHGEPAPTTFAWSIWPKCLRWVLLENFDLEGTIQDLQPQCADLQPIRVCSPCNKAHNDRRKSTSSSTTTRPTW